MNASKVSLLSEVSKGRVNPNYSEYRKRMEKAERMNEYSSVVKVLNIESTHKRPQTFDGSQTKVESKREKAIAFAKAIPKPKSGIRLQRLEASINENDMSSRLQELERRHEEYRKEVLRIKSVLNV